MPIYEYRCPGCSNRFDLLRSFSQADEAVKCPKCGKKAKRLVSSFASFSKGAGGESTPIGGGSSCGSCASSSCST
ncbi:MAG: zinc ribbon domain-containing protein [Dehalococcoidia bacterium]|nr:zinc ribbon domain-containing protein [Dehalococcoidia bacterium]